MPNRTRDPKPTHRFNRLHPTVSRAGLALLVAWTPAASADMSLVALLTKPLIAPLTTDIYVCNGPYSGWPSSTSTRLGSANFPFSRLQDAVNSVSKRIGSLAANIHLCPGTYSEDIQLASKGTIRFVGYDSVTLEGAGVADAVVTYVDACTGSTGDRHCYTKASFENIDFVRASGASIPTTAISADAPTWVCTTTTCRFKRAAVTLSDGWISGFDVAVLARGAVDLTATRMSFEANASQSEAGVIQLLDGGEMAPVDGASGCTSLDWNPSAVFEDSDFIRNASYSVIYSDAAKVEIRGSYFTENDESLAATCSELSASDTIFEKNSGRVLLLENSSATLETLTVVSNTATSRGGFLYLLDSDATLSGSLVDGNTSSLGGGVFFSSGNFASAGSSWSRNSPQDVYHSPTGASFYPYGGNADFACDSTGCY